MYKELSFISALLLTAVLLMPAASVLAATMYKWTDEDGNVQFSQSPPPKGSFQQLNTHGSQSNSPILSDTAKNSAPMSEPEADDKDPIEDKQEKERKRLEADIAEYNCSVGRKNLEDYSNSKNFINTKGEVVSLTDEERSARIKAAQELVDKYCQ
ncbi:MAG: DUF4124 domain-containing protein [Thiohalomonadaceae bacterium]